VGRADPSILTLHCGNNPQPFSLAHDLVRKPVPTPHQVRGRLFRDHARRKTGRPLGRPAA